jgi:hypothetical protein
MTALRSMEEHSIAFEFSAAEVAALVFALAAAQLATPDEGRLFEWPALEARLESALSDWRKQRRGEE